MSEKYSIDNSAFFAQIGQDIMDYNNNFAQAALKKAADDITVFANSVIARFYAAYLPPENKYDRTNNFKNNSVRRYYRNNGKGWGFAGVEFGSKYMDDYVTQNVVTGKIYNTRSADDVIPYLYEGWHGRSGVKSEATKTAIENYCRDPKFRQSVIDHGIQSANKVEYTYLTFK